MGTGRAFQAVASTTVPPPRGHIRGVISRDLREAGTARHTRQNNDRRGQTQAGPKEGIFLPHGRISTLLWGRRTWKCVGSTDVRRHSQTGPDQPDLGLEFYSYPCQKRLCTEGTSPYPLAPPTHLKMETIKYFCHVVRRSTP